MKISSVYAVLLSGAMVISCVGGASAFAEEEPSLIFGTAGISASSKLPAPKNIKASDITETSVALKWDKVKGANGYKVYIYNTEKKKYALYKTVKGTSCKVEGLRAGKTYIFAVAAAAKKGGKTTAQERSKGVQVTTAAKPKKAAKKYALKKYTLKDKTVKVVATKELFPEDGATAKLFKDIYGGNIKWLPTVEGWHYSDLTTWVLGGEGVDLFAYYEDKLSKGVSDGNFQPIDGYADLDSDLWQSISAGVESGKVNGKHYLFATEITESGEVKGFNLVTGASNPDGAARLAECELYLHTSSNAKNMESGKKKSSALLDERLRLPEFMAASPYALDE